jgi:hypothetical protein
LPGTDWGACDNVKKPEKTMMAQAVIVLLPQGSSRDFFLKLDRAGYVVVSLTIWPQEGRIWPQEGKCQRAKWR